MIKIIELKQLVIENKKEQIKKVMKKYFDDCSKKYFSDVKGKYSYPSFNVKPNLRHAGAYSPQRNQFTMNLDFSQDLENLKSTMYHETIHYYQTKGGQEFSKMMHKLHGYHDDYFKEKMKKINAGEGKELVSIIGTFQTIKSGKAAKPYYVYVLQKNKDYMMSWSPTRIPGFIDRWKRVKDYYKYDNAFVFQTDNVKFKENPRAKTSGRRVPMGALRPGHQYYDEMTKEFQRAKKETI